MLLNRRSFLKAHGGVVALPLLAGLPPSLCLGDAAKAARNKPYGALLAQTSKTVSFVYDMAPLSPREHVARLAHLVETSADVSDAYLEGGAVGELEARAAALFGKEAAAFLPTGTLANNIAVRVHCGESHRALVQQRSHLYADESDSAAVLSGLNLVPLTAATVTPSIDEINAAVHSAEHGHFPVKIGAMSLESPFRARSGATIPFAELQKIAAVTQAHGIKLHWDGARSLLMTGIPGFDLKAYAALFDSVYLSLYKYLDAPFGAVLMGNAQFIAAVKKLRHIYGGLIYQGWSAALPALAALGSFQEKFMEARAVFDFIVRGLQATGDFQLEPVANGSNITYVQVAPGRLPGLAERLTAADIYVRMTPAGRMEMYTNLSLLRREPRKILSAFLSR